MLDAIVLAVALSMDASAISACCGAAGMSSAAAFRMAALFSLFHIAMATIGWMIGAAAETWISAWDHWVAFGLLTVIGLRMGWSALRPGAVEIPATWGLLIALAIATSLDAIAAGVTLPLLELPELVIIGMIGSVVFILVLMSVKVGALLGVRFGRGLQVAGGVAIIAIGVRILLQHL